MIRLQTYFMIGLHTPNLVWNAVIHTWPWFQHLQQDTVNAGFNLDSERTLEDTEPVYELEMMTRFFSRVTGGFSIEDRLEFYEDGVWQYYEAGLWTMQDKHYFYNDTEVTISEWYEQYRKKTKEHVELFG